MISIIIIVAAHYCYHDHHYYIYHIYYSLYTIIIIIIIIIIIYNGIYPDYHYFCNPEISLLTSISSENIEAEEQPDTGGDHLGPADLADGPWSGDGSGSKLTKNPRRKHPKRKTRFLYIYIYICVPHRQSIF